MLRLERFFLLSEYPFPVKSYYFSTSNNNRQLAHRGVVSRGVFGGGGLSLKLLLEGSTLLNSPQAQFIKYSNKNRRRAILPLEGVGRQVVVSGEEYDQGGDRQTCAIVSSMQSPLKVLTLKKSILMKLFPSLQIIKLGNFGSNVYK